MASRDVSSAGLLTKAISVVAYGDGPSIAIVGRMSKPHDVDAATNSVAGAAGNAGETMADAGASPGHDRNKNRFSGKIAW